MNANAVFHALQGVARSVERRPASDAIAALRAELAAAQDIADALSGERDEWRDGCRSAEAEVALLKDENKELVAGLEPFAAWMVPDADPRSVSGWRYGVEPKTKHYQQAYTLLRARSLTATKGG